MAVSVVKIHSVVKICVMNLDDHGDEDQCIQDTEIVEVETTSRLRPPTRVK